MNVAYVPSNAWSLEIATSKADLKPFLTELVECEVNNNRKRPCKTEANQL